MSYFLLWASAVLLCVLVMGAPEQQAPIEFVYVREATSMHGHNIRTENTIHVKNTAPLGTNRNVLYVDFLLWQEHLPYLTYIVAYSELQDKEDSSKAPEFSVLKQMDVEPEDQEQLRRETDLYTPSLLSRYIPLQSFFFFIIDRLF